jgi:hypothetical protein
MMILLQYCTVSLLFTNSKINNGARAVRTTSRNCARNNLSKSSSVVLNISIQKREIPTIQLLLEIQRLIINVKRNFILEIIMEPFSSTNSTRTSCLFRKKSDGHQELSRNCRINSCMTPSKKKHINHSFITTTSTRTCIRNNKSYTHTPQQQRQQQQ